MDFKPLIIEDGKASYWPDFIKPSLAEKYLAQLLTELNWRQETIRLFGRDHPCPRLIAWYGDAGLSYAYSGIKHQSFGWSPTLLAIKAELETKLQMHFNGVLANYYRNGKDSMGWHSDAERGLSSTIASISLGQTRRFLFKHRQNKCLQEVKLESGSLLLMQDELQRHWLHCLPKQTKATQARVNLTFRQLESS